MEGRLVVYNTVHILCERGRVSLIRRRVDKGAVLLGDTMDDDGPDRVLAPIRLNSFRINQRKSQTLFSHSTTPNYFGASFQQV